MINPFKKHYSEIKSGGHMEVAGSATKIIFNVDSLDYMPIDDRYTAMKKIVLGIDKKIKKCKKDFEKAEKISKAYADSYCPDEFEIRYNGKEKSITDDLLLKVQKDIDAEKIGRVLRNQAITYGVMSNVPIIGDAYIYNKSRKNIVTCGSSEARSRCFVASLISAIALGARANTLIYTITGDFDGAAATNSIATGASMVSSALNMSTDTTISKLEKTDIAPYLAIA